MQPDGHQAYVVDDALGVDQLRPSAEGGFAYGHLELVDIADYAVRHRRLVDFAEVLVGVAVHNAAFCPFGMACGRKAAEITVHAVVVGAVCHDNRPVGRGFLAYDEAGAGFRAVGGEETESRQREHPDDVFLHTLLCVETVGVTISRP